jgi:hypothetical protein
LEQLLPILIVGMSFIAVLTFIRTIASFLRLAVVALLVFAIAHVALHGKIPFTGKSIHLPIHALRIK